MSQRFCKTTAFTLIELLVVIAIISLLVSILLPSLTMAKDLARRVACSAQSKSIGFSLQLYAEDNDSRYPLGGLGNKFHVSDIGRPWFDLLCKRFSYSPMEYGLTWEDSFICPAEDLGFGPYANGLYFYTHYMVNHWVMDDPNDAFNPPDVLENPSEALRPSATILMSENNRLNTPGNLWLGPPTNPTISFRHMDTANALYLDGHVDVTDYLTIYDNNKGDGTIRDGIWKFCLY